VIAQQPRQRRRFHRHDRQFEIERAAFCDADSLRATPTTEIPARADHR
jgi:hypothetical protein